MTILIKDNGDSTPFEKQKFKNSLLKSGASEIQIDKILKEIEPRIYEGMPTRELYQWAHELLQNQSPAFAARYSLKKALMKLGPAGYYFEKWIAQVLEHLTYRTLHSKIIKGFAVSHEADVIAEREGQLFWIECKFRNSGESKISVTTPMYVLSRIKDISNKKFKFWNEEMEFTNGILVTNSYFTQDSIDFAEYYGLDLLGWDYPAQQNLKSLVDLGGLYPITCLTSLDKEDLQKLLEKNIILVKTLKDKLSNVQLKNQTAIAQEVDDLLKLSAF